MRLTLKITKSGLQELKQMNNGIKIQGISSQRSKICLAVGHTQMAKGAVSKDGIYEFDFNNNIASLVQGILRSKYNAGIEVTIRQEDNYDNYSVDFAKIATDTYTNVYELHFNAASGLGSGAEFLCLQQETGAAFANAMMKNFIDKGFALHGGGLKYLTSNDRGYLLLRNLQDVKCATVIVEPCFGDNRQDPNYNLVFADRGGKYASMLAETIYNLHFKVV